MGETMGHHAAGLWQEPYRIDDLPGKRPTWRRQVDHGMRTGGTVPCCAGRTVRKMRNASPA